MRRQVPQVGAACLRGTVEAVSGLGETPCTQGARTESSKDDADLPQVSQVGYSESENPNRQDGVLEMHAGR